MNKILAEDLINQKEILENVLEEAEVFLNRRCSERVAPYFDGGDFNRVPLDGMGAKAALDLFKRDYAPYLWLNSGPQFYGFVIGGATPAALAGDWLTSLYDQNAFGIPGRIDRKIEEEAAEGIKELLSLPEDYSGVFTSGATMASTVALAVAREWAAQKEGKSANDGIYGLTQPTVISGCPHASLAKGLSILGIGRNAITYVPCLEGREAVDVSVMEDYIKNNLEKSIIVIANMGTANSGDLDDLKAIAELKDKYEFYLHVDGAVGAISAASDKYRPLFDGCEKADSFTVDCHKWLNVPYDCAIAYVRGEALKKLQYRVFAQQSIVAGEMPVEAAFYDYAPEGSRRLRALSVWMSLMAYGKNGYAEMVERDCDMAKLLADEITKDGNISLVNDVRLNGFAFTINMPYGEATMEDIMAFAELIRKAGKTYMNTSTVVGKPAIRCSISNYATSEKEILDVANAILECAKKFVK